MSKHTPGPWGQAKGRIWCNHMAMVAITEPSESPCWLDKETAHANARLIAAAPELLAALTDAVTVWPFNETSALLTAMKAAIAKATGVKP